VVDVVAGLGGGWDGRGAAVEEVVVCGALVRAPPQPATTIVATTGIRAGAHRPMRPIVPTRT